MIGGYFGMLVVIFDGGLMATKKKTYKVVAGAAGKGKGDLARRLAKELPGATVIDPMAAKKPPKRKKSK